MKTLTAREMLDRHFLEMRAKLIEIAADLDRIDRSDGPADDPRLALLRQAIDTLNQDGDGRAENLQLLFSLPYDPEWRMNFGKEPRTS